MAPAEADVIIISSDSEEDQTGPINPGPVHAPFRALDDASRPQLRLAIATMPEKRVREAFVTLINDIPAVSEHVFRMLVAVQRFPAEQEEASEDETSDDRDEDEDGDGAHRSVRKAERFAMGRTVLVPRWQICTNCNEEFDAAMARRYGECRYHSGDLEVNEGEFVDWDEDCHGPMDTDDNRQQYPENFMWWCCDRDGTSVGCEKGEHEPELQQGRHKRVRCY